MPPPARPARNGAGLNRHIAVDEFQPFEGWVYISNQNFSRKHDERVFFTIAREPKRIPLKKEWTEAWKELIADYRDIHEKELEKRRAAEERRRKGSLTREQEHAAYARFEGRDPGKTGWSAHVYDDTWKDLGSGTLCYAKVDRDGRITGLYPVMISRGLHDTAPWGLLDPSLRPATEPGELSPADRVFGWVGQDGKGAYRGNLRIGPVEPLGGPASIENFAAPLPLAILGQPKPSYARFYVAADRKGRPQAAGLSRPETGFDKRKGLSGRKVYPHHAQLPEDYWQGAATDTLRQPVAGNRFREYLRPVPPAGEDGHRQDDQNRSIDGWVKPGSHFHFDIEVSHLSKVELGALVWLLRLPNNAFHRLGGGKPLGFGSVRLDIKTGTICDGKALAERYEAFTASPKGLVDLDDAIQAFRDAVVEAAGGLEFERVPWIAAFLSAACGIGSDRQPIHYPRVRQANEGGIYPPPRWRGENFKWFQENDRAGGRFGLPDPGDGKPAPLPVYELEPNGSGRRR